MTWDYEKKEYEKQAKADPVWHMEHLINYGLNGEKLNEEMLKKHFAEIKMPENRRDFLELLLWNKKF